MFMSDTDVVPTSTYHSSDLPLRDVELRTVVAGMTSTQSGDLIRVRASTSLEDALHRQYLE